MKQLPKVQNVGAGIEHGDHVEFAGGTGNVHWVVEGSHDSQQGRVLYLRSGQTGRRRDVFEHEVSIHTKGTRRG